MTDAVRVLALGAHPDDVELGCGGTLLLHADRGDQVTVAVAASMFGIAARQQEAERAVAALGASLLWGPFRDGELGPPRAVVGFVDEVLESVQPDVIYAHAANDTHQDHRAVADAARAGIRRGRSLLLYETPSTLHFAPTVFVDVSRTLSRKLGIVAHHSSQIAPLGALSAEHVELRARFRGTQATLPAAEAFASERLVLDLGALRAIDS